MLCHLLDERRAEGEARGCAPSLNLPLSTSHPQPPTRNLPPAALSSDPTLPLLLLLLLPGQCWTSVFRARLRSLTLRSPSSLPLHRTRSARAPTLP